jgi:hypothetical protein
MMFIGLVMKACILGSWTVDICSCCWRCHERRRNWQYLKLTEHRPWNDDFFFRQRLRNVCCKFVLLVDFVNNFFSVVYCNGKNCYLRLLTQLLGNIMLRKIDGYFDIPSVRLIASLEWMSFFLKALFLRPKNWSYLIWVDSNLRLRWLNKICCHFCSCCSYHCALRIRYAQIEFWGFPG